MVLLNYDVSEEHTFYLFIEKRKVYKLDQFHSERATPRSEFPLNSKQKEKQTDKISWKHIIRYETMTKQFVSYD